MSDAMLPAAPAAHELGLQAGEIEAYWALQQDIEVLERDVGRVREMHRLEHGVDGLQAAGIADAFQVGFEIEGVAAERVLR